MYCATPNAATAAQVQHVQGSTARLKPKPDHETMAQPYAQAWDHESTSGIDRHPPVVQVQIVRAGYISDHADDPRSVEHGGVSNGNVTFFISSTVQRPIAAFRFVEQVRVAPGQSRHWQPLHPKTPVRTIAPQNEAIRIL